MWKQQHNSGQEWAGQFDPSRWVVPRAVLVVGLLATLVGCGGPLLIGINNGWSLAQVGLYAGLTLIYLWLTLACNLILATAHVVQRVPAVYLGLIGLVCLALQSLSGDPNLQPIIFTIPLVGVSLMYPPLKTLAVALFYLALMALGLLFGGQIARDIVVFPLIGYATLMALIYSFTRALDGQEVARRRADQLAEDLARQRDYMARLAQLTATLTRDLDLSAVLEQVAAAGQSLARADQARVWLRDEDADGNLRLAAAVPAQAVNPQQPVANDLAVSATNLALPLVFKDSTIGMLELCGRDQEPFSEQDAKLLQPFADTAAVAIQNARLYEQAGLTATLTERNRLARELHDTIAQGLTAVTMHLEAAQRSLDRYPDRARARLARATELSRETLQDVRRSVWTLAEPPVDGAGLAAALDEQVKRFAERTGLEAKFSHTGPAPAIDSAAATQTLRIVQELLLNVEKHAEATNVAVCLSSDANTVQVCVQDDGKGFDPQAPTAANSVGFGLFSLRERARLAGGALTINSSPGAGTQGCLTLAPHN